jgi:hypothetical protein
VDDIIAPPIATWHAPNWATRTTIEGDAVRHSHWPATELYQLGDDDTPVPLVPQVTAADRIGVDVAGQVTVHRPAEPVIALSDLRLTLGQADALGRALVELAQIIEHLL